MVATAAVRTLLIPLAEATVAQGRTLDVIATLRTRIPGLEAQTRAAPVLTIPIPAHSPRQPFTRPARLPGRQFTPPAHSPRQLVTTMHLIRLLTARLAPDPTVEGLPEVVKRNMTLCATLDILMADRVRDRSHRSFEAWRGRRSFQDAVANSRRCESEGQT
jgi:hypothetical protein